MTHGIARKGFDQDLLDGLAREDAFVYSFWKKSRAEHKSDEKAKETGNFFVEFETSKYPEGFGDKYPSGITVCDAELWVTEFRPDCWVILPTDYMRTLVHIAETRNATKWGGDYNRFHGALVSWRWLLQPPAPRGSHRTDDVMKSEQAEEFTEALGQVLGGAVRLAEWAPHVGIPEALGLTAQEWAQRRLTGQVRLSIEERRLVVDANPDKTTRELGEALGVTHTTIENDRHELDPGKKLPEASDDVGNNLPEDRRLGFLMSSASDEWETPQDLYDTIAAEFHPELDVRIADVSKVRPLLHTEVDGLVQDWTGVCWMNPPYGGEIGRWIEKAHDAARHGATVVCLVPARVETNWWWDHCRHGEIRFLRGRLRFGGADSGAPFPSALVIFKPDAQARVLWWERP